MSECKKAQEQLEELLRDELCTEEAQAIRQHIDQCPECRAEERVCQTLTEAVQRACREKAPDALRNEILTKLQLG